MENICWRRKGARTWAVVTVAVNLASNECSEREVATTKSEGDAKKICRLLGAESIRVAIANGPVEDPRLVIRTLR